MSQPGDRLSQAGDVLRQAPEPGWDAIAARVVGAVRATPRSDGWPLLALVDGNPGAGQVFVSDNVLRSTLAVVLRSLFRCVPTAIEFDVEGNVLHGVHIDVTGSYGTDLHGLADRIRATAGQTVTDLLGHADRGNIDVTITDVVTGDPVYV